MTAVALVVLVAHGVLSDMPIKDQEKRREYSRQAARRWRAENPDAAREKSRKDAAIFRQKNPDKVLATNRAWYAKNIEYARSLSRRRAAKWRRENPVAFKRACDKWNAAHPDKIRARTQKRYWENRTYVLEQNRIWRTVNKEIVAKKKQEWGKKNRHKHVQYSHTRRALLLQSSGQHTAAQARARVAFFGDRCAYCGDPFKHLDHAIALSRGGSNWPANIRPACVKCNTRKHAKNWRDWPVLI